jgi:tripartite ATP-independent transporter DctP family solute receptor
MMKTTATTAATALVLSVLAQTAFAQEFVMKFSSDLAPMENHFIQTPLAEFETELEELSDGRIDVQIFYSGQLGNGESVMTQLRTGLTEAILFADGALAPFYPDVQVLGIPYLFVNRDVAHAVLDGRFGKELADNAAAQSGIRPIAWMENGGYRHFSANVPLQSPADFQGLKFRTLPNPIHQQIVRSLGASPTPIPWADLYTSLKTGVVDGQENSLSVFRLPKLEEAQSHIILDGHVYAVLGFYISEKFYQSLPPELQKAVNTAVASAVAKNRKMSAEAYEGDLQYLTEYGLTIYEPPLEVLQEFQALTQQDAIDFLESEGVSTELVETLRTETKDAEAKILSN